MSVRAYLRLMRPGDWTKNVFVLPAFLFSLPRLFVGGDASSLLPQLGAVLAAFAAFSLAASGFYAINDARDAPSDRLHPVKRRRPVASGAITPTAAFLFGTVLLVIGIATAFAINRGTGSVLLFYAVLQAAYNLGLKRVAIVDAVVVSLGFALRAAAGAMAIEVQVSIWLLLCVFFLCLYLAFIKRLFDITAAARDRHSSWRSAAGYDSPDELNWLLALSGVPAVMTYLMYTLSDHARALFGVRSSGLALLVPLVLIAMHRFYARSRRGLSDSPLDAMRSDGAVLASILLFAAGTVIMLLAPGVESTLDALFMLDTAEVADAPP